MMTAPIAVAPRARRWPRLLVILGFALLFAWDLWEAVQNLVLVPQFAAQLGLGTEQVPWWLLGLDVSLPVIVFVGALFLARRRGTGVTAIVLVTGLSLVAAWSILLTAIAPLAIASQL